MRLPLIMVRETLLDLPAPVRPAGFSHRLYRIGDRSVWARIETAAGEFPDTDAALRQFAQEFEPSQTDMEDRCFFAVDEGSGQEVATATAWYNEERGAEWGRLHWVGAVPEYHGLGLGRFLVALALHRFARDHARAYLTTRTTSVAAVKIYLDVGFRPSFETPGCPEAWAHMRSLIDHPALHE